MNNQKIQRGILKISGEMFADKENHISFEKFDIVAKQIIDIQKRAGIQLAVVVGGGNIFRGRQADLQSHVDHTEADAMGMMATVINGIGLREALVRHGAFDTRLMTAFELRDFAEPYIKLKGRHHLSQNRLVIIAGGLGKPNFSTDSAVAQYADELECQIIFKASTVNGVYDQDPQNHPNAKCYSRLTIKKALLKELKIMDTTAFAMCLKSGIPVFVFDFKDLDKLPRAVKGNYSFGTLITKSEKS